MPVRQVVPQHIQQSRLNAAGIIGRTFHLRTDLVGAFKADIQPVSTELIRVLLDPFNGLHAPLLKTAYSLVRRQAVFSQRQHDLPQAELGGELLPDFAGPFG